MKEEGHLQLLELTYHTKLDTHTQPPVASGTPVDVLRVLQLKQLPVEPIAKAGLQIQALPSEFGTESTSEQLHTAAVLFTIQVRLAGQTQLVLSEEGPVLYLTDEQL